MLRRISLTIAVTLALAACAPKQIASPTSAPAALPAATHIVLPASAGRSVDLSLWIAPAAKGVVEFDHGYGGSPAAYSRLILRWVAAGYSVVAPLNLDSQSGPLHGQVDPETVFKTRIEDMMIARGFIAQRFPGQRVILAGHSFGSLIALIGGGASTPAGNLGGPLIAGIIAFSTPGSVPGLVTPTSFAHLAAPLLLVTGDADTVPGFVTDWHDHRLAFDSAPAGGKTLLLFAGGNHDLVASTGPAFDTAAAATIDFLDAYAAGDRRAHARLAGLKSAGPLTVAHR